MRILIIAITLVITAISCINPPEYSEIPEISAATVDRTEATPGEDSIVVEFKFQDGDGDLGNKERDSTINAYLVDARTGFPYNYQIPYISERGNNRAISGTIWITVDPFTFNCRPNRPDKDTLAYEIYIVDRAGNESNRLTTPPIILDCP